MGNLKLQLSTRAMRQRESMPWSLAAQHDDKVQMTDLRADIKQAVIKDVIPSSMMDEGHENLH